MKYVSRFNCEPQFEVYFSFKDARGDQCDGCSRTLDAIELIKPRCIVNKSHIVTTRLSSHMYVRLDVVQPRAEAFLKKSWKEGKWSPNAVINGEGEIIDARMKSGLKPTPITRDLTWGVPVPVQEGDDDQGMKGKVLCKCFSNPCRFLSLFPPALDVWVSSIKPHYPLLSLLQSSLMHH